MARIENQTIELTINGTLPIWLKAHYDYELSWWKGFDGMEWRAEVKLGYIEWALAGHKMYDLEGKEIPVDMQALVLSSIPELTEEEAREAAEDYEDQERFHREHAAGRI